MVLLGRVPEHHAVGEEVPRAHDRPDRDVRKDAASVPARVPRAISGVPFVAGANEVLLPRAEPQILGRVENRDGVSDQGLGLEPEEAFDATMGGENASVSCQQQRGAVVKALEEKVGEFLGANRA